METKKKKKKVGGWVSGNGSKRSMTKMRPNCRRDEKETCRGKRGVERQKLTDKEVWNNRGEVRKAAKKKKMKSVRKGEEKRTAERRGRN